IPVDRVRDLKAYRLQGTAELDHFRLVGLELERVNARVAFIEGVLHLEELSARLAPDPNVKGGAGAGTLEAPAALQRAPIGDLSAQVDVRDFPLERLARVVPALAGRLQGAVSGTVAARAPAEKLRAPDAWDATGKLTAAQVSVYGLAVREARFG